MHNAFCIKMYTYWLMLGNANSSAKGRDIQNISRVSRLMFQYYMMYDSSILLV